MWLWIAVIDFVKIMIFTSTCDMIATSPCAIVLLLLTTVSFQIYSAANQGVRELAATML